MTADYETWLAAATKRLVPEGAACVRAETAGRDAASLGGAFRANMRYRRRYLTEYDAARIGRMAAAQEGRSKGPRMVSRHALATVLQARRFDRIVTIPVTAVFVFGLGVAIGYPHTWIGIALGQIAVCEFFHGMLIRKLHNTGLADWRPHAERTAP